MSERISFQDSPALPVLVGKMKDQFKTAINQKQNLEQYV